jgi:hypothetical protein
MGVQLGLIGVQLGGKVIWAGLRGRGCGAGTAGQQREAFIGPAFCSMPLRLIGSLPLTDTTVENELCGQDALAFGDDGPRTHRDHDLTYRHAIGQDSGSGRYGWFPQIRVMGVQVGLRSRNDKCGPARLAS